MSIQGDDADCIKQRIYDLLYDETKDYFEEYTIENVKATIWSVLDGIIDAIREDVWTYVDALAERILEDCLGSE